MIETTDILGKEIARVGKFEAGKELTEKHLNDFVTNFEAKTNEPYLNIDHDEKFTDKVKDALKVLRLGTISRLYRQGQSLFADFKGVPKQIAELIDKGLLGQRSIEYFRELTREGKKCENVLHAVSFFGKDLPAIPKLGDYVPALYAGEVSEMIKVNMTHAEEMAKKLSKEVLPMEDLQVYKDQITTLKSEVEKFKSENAALIKQVNDLEASKKDLEKYKVEFEAFKADVAKAADAALAKEADVYVSAQIQAKKVLPAYKEDYKSDYVAKAKESVERLERFKKEIEARAELMPVQLKDGEISGDEYTREILTSTDRMEEAIQHHMKKFKVDWEKAREEVLAKIQ